MNIPFLFFLGRFIYTKIVISEYLKLNNTNARNKGHFIYFKDNKNKKQYITPKINI